MTIVTVGIDLAKNVFAVRGVNEAPGYQDPVPWRAARCVSASRGSNVNQTHSATRSNAGRGAAEVSRGHSSGSVLHESG